jgi:two-component system, NarL family, sensor histidine kinase BarA
VRRVLIVDDEPEIASLVALCLDPLGVEVVQASGLSSALRIARQGDIGLVLLDLALGAEDGLEILPRLRDEPNLSGVPVVAFTAHDSRRREAIDSGVDSFLPRPFASADLQSTVELYLVS